MNINSKSLYTFSFLLIFSSNVFSDSDSSDFTKAYIGFSYVNVELGGAMDGVTAVGNSDSFAILPEQEAGGGGKLSAGTYSSDASFELNYVFSNHDGQWLGFPTRSEFRSFNIDGKIAFGESDLQPQIIVGLGLSSVNIIDGATNFVDVSDAKYRSVDLRFGGGLRYRIMDNLSLETNMIFRRGNYNKIEGPVSRFIQDDISSNGVTASFEIIYLFDINKPGLSRDRVGFLTY